MDRISAIESLEALLRANGIGFTLQGHEGLDAKSLDYGIRGLLFPSFDYARMGSWFLGSARPGALCQLEDSFHLIYSLFRLEGEPYEDLRPWLEERGKGDGRGCAFVLGPVRFLSARKDEITLVMKALRLGEEARKDLSEFCNRIPVVPGDFWNNTLSAFLYLITGQRPVSLSLDRESFPVMENEERKEEEYGHDRFAYQTIEERYSWENSILDAVARGDKEEALRSYSLFRKYRISPRTADALRNRKNMAVILNTLLRKAVEKGGVHPYHIDEVSHKFAVQIETSLSLGHIDRLARAMIAEYSGLARECSREGFSSIVRDTASYIDFNYSRAITLEELGRLFSVSPGHLSRTFSRETGMGIIEYANRRRIQASRQLLESSAMSVAEIASRCGFSSPDYYARVFKKETGMTPSEYRKSLLRQKG